MSAVIPEGSVIITPTDMYREMVETHQAVRELAAKFDSAQGDTKRRLDTLDSDFADHETRLRGVERRIWMAVGGGTVVGGSVAALITQMVTKH